jgi:ferrochelatase
MRYGNPSIATTIKKIKKENPFVTDIMLIPLYPHYSMSSYETVEVKVREKLDLIGHEVNLEVVKPFYSDQNYIKLLSDKIASYHPENYDQVLFSYHGIPERHVKKTDPSGTHCLKVDDCCSKSNACQAFCYRHQTRKMTDYVSESLGLPETKVATAYQSKLGNKSYLQPYTDQRLESLAKDGVKKLLVICPAFVSDCLETLEEIEIEGQGEFIENGGEDFKVVPCLNDDDEWADLLAQWISDFQANEVSYLY